MSRRTAENIARVSLIVVLLLVAPETIAQVPPCQWTHSSTSIVEACGFVGIGTSAPHAPLHVTTPNRGHSLYTIIERTSSGSDGAVIFRTTREQEQRPRHDWFVGYSGITGSDDFWFSSASFASPNLVLTAGGKAGVATGSPAATLDVLGWPGAPGDLANGAFNAGGDIFAGVTGPQVSRLRMSSNAARGLIQWNLYWNGTAYRSLDYAKPAYELDMNGSSDALTVRRYAAAPNGNVAAGTALLTILGSGNVGIGVAIPAARLHVEGDAVFTGTVRGGNIQAHYQDVAEWVPATTELEPGTVVVLNRSRNNEVMRSSVAYDTTVAGVVSEQPGLILGEGGAGREQIATTGRVRIKVDATNGPIAIGDLLVTSDAPGKAMRSVPMEISGRSFHQPGTIIGKALEPLAGGEGEILVLLSLQ